ncbi:MAG: hydrogenase nickel incorporation protein HypB [Spirochaetales bacterium]|nr:hydrogenase nickel incorporation protein HypB [Spirochaetales bacterium]
MDEFKVIEIKKSIFEGNDRKAEELREDLKKRGVFLMNLMSSPGSGKTTTVMRTIEALKDDFRIGVLEADIDSDVDAKTVSTSGAKVIQLHTGGMCHLDATMTEQGLTSLGTEDLDFVVLENIGNLICTADFDTGSAMNTMILSVPEGDDKPLKYPNMFAMVDVLIINKMDAAEFFDFDLEAVKERVFKLNPDIKVFPVSAKTGEGISEWTMYLKNEVKNWKEI